MFDGNITERFVYRLATFSSKETFLVYPTLTSFTQKKRKTHNANDLLTLLLIGIIVNIYFLRKKLYCTYLNVTEHEMVLSYEKTFNEKMREQLVKI